jgi:hypothetical protein
VPNVIDSLKETKNEREIKGMYECHTRDGVALVFIIIDFKCGYLAWLE